MEVIDKSFDGILGIKLSNLVSDKEIIFFACYLPPENSPRGRDAQGFFAHLLSQIYMNSDSETFLLAGDFNARIGNLSETLTQTDNIPNRIALDKTMNQHGHEFIDFLNEAKFVVLNGRFEEDADNYTSISRKGKAVVDYMCTPQDSLNDIINFKVLPIQCIVDKNKLHSMIGERSKVPDHSVITCEFKYQHETVSEYKNDNPIDKPPRYRLDRIPLDFMTSEIRRQALILLIEQIERSRETQDNVDIIYDNLCNVIIAEMDDKIPRVDSDKSRRRYKHNKPYWNNELSVLWNAMNLKEKAFTNCKGNRRVKSGLRSEYINARDKFDKLLRRTEREYKRSKAMEIETFSTKNPNEF